MTWQTFRTFVDGICCRHVWAYIGSVAQLFARSHQRCVACGATCRRNATGQIIEYSADAEPLGALGEYRGEHDHLVEQVA